MDKLELQRCYQVNAAWTRSFEKWVDAGMEAYGKWYDREYPFFKPYYRSYNYHYYHDENGRPIREFSPPDGRRKVYGTELYVKGTPWKRFNYRGSFAIFKAQDRYTDGYWYDDTYGLCRKLGLAASVILTKGHSVSASLMAMSGRRYTSDEACNGNDFGSDGKKDYYDVVLQPIISLSLKYSFRHTFRRCTPGADVDVVNVLNQKIVIDKEYTGNDYYAERRLDGTLPIVGIWMVF